MFFYNSRFFQATVTLTVWSSINLNTQRYLAIFAWFLLTGAALGGLDSDLRCMGANTVSLRIVRQYARGFFFQIKNWTKQNVERHKSRFLFSLLMVTSLICLTDMEVQRVTCFLFCSFWCGQFWWQDRLDLQDDRVAKLVREGHHLSKV